MPGDLGTRLAELEERVGRLEQRQQRAQPPESGRAQFDAQFDEDGVAGSVLFAGTATTPGTAATPGTATTVDWQEEHPLPALLAGSWAEAAGALAALGHPVRLELIRRLLAGAHTTHELAEIPDLGTSGQLYHHLRELQAAGLVIQRRRNDYAVPADRVIPCLVLVAAAQSCAHVGEIAS